MNAPYFDVTRIPTDPCHPDFILAVIREEKRVCDPIDARIFEEADRFQALYREIKALEARLGATRGFFARWGIRMQLDELHRRLDNTRTVHYRLSMERWKRTYGA